MSTKISITPQTSVGELYALLNEKGVDAHTRLRGKGNDKDGYTLYLDTKASSLFDRMRGKAHERNKAAAAGIKMVVKNFERSAHQSGFHPRDDGVSTLFRRIDQRTNLEDRRALRGDQILNLAKGAALLGDKLGYRPGSVLLPAVDAKASATVNGPHLDLNLTASQKMRLADAALGAGGNEGPEASISTMADVALAAIGGAALSKETERALAMSLGVSVKSQIRDAVSAQLGKHGVSLPADFEAMLDKAFDRAGSAILGTRQVGDAVPTTISKQGQDTIVELPVIEIKGKQYEAKKYLGEGTFGNVYLYVNKQDPKDTVAFKICKTDSFGRSAEVVRGETAQEVLSHDKAMASGSNNVLKLEGAVRLSAGTIGIALESAPNGSVFDMAKSLGLHIGDRTGQLTASEAKVVRLTLLQGVIQGLKDLHDQGLMHLDFKSPNCLIGPDCRTKVMDFGTLTEATSIRAGDMPSAAENPRYLSPESMIANNAAADLSTAKLAGLAERMTADVELIFPNLETTEQAKIASLLAKDTTEKSMAAAHDRLGQTMDGAHDTWGAGLAALELFSGRELLPQLSFIDDVRSTVVDWASNPNNKALSPQTTGPLPTSADGRALAIGQSTGDAQVDDLINKMLAPNPRDRISLEDALKHPAFRTAGVGDPAVAAFIPTLLADNDSFEAKTKLEVEVSNYHTYLDGKFVEFGNPDVSAQDLEILTAGTATRADRDRIFASLPPARQSELQRNYGGLSNVLDQLTALDQKVATVEAAIAAAKSGLDAIINPPLRDARRGQTSV